MSKVIHNPALAAVNELSANEAEFVIEPLYANYGYTLGNSMRRVLLSSIEGGAIVAFRIEGATHEFTTVDGVKEDVVDIMLNLKNVRLKVHSDEPVELRLEKKGAGEITAADIKANADVDIFGDGSVLTLHLPGHTPDHMALLVNLRSGPVMLTGDLYHSTEAREKRGVPPFNSSREQTLASMDKFEAKAKETGAKVIIQHEPADISKLPAFPKAAE